MGARRVVLAAAVILGVGVLLGLPATSASGAVNPNLGKASHGHMANGKALSHVSGGSEVTFDEERALGADAQAAADLPLDASVSALLRELITTTRQRPPNS